MFEFDEEKHIYKLDGKVLPSITQICSVVSNLYYEEVDKSILEKASYRGTQVHNAIENYLKYGDYVIDNRYEDYMIKFKKFLELENFKSFEILEIENRYHNTQYAGTIDLLVKYKDKIILIDHKTSAKINDKLIKLQFAGYSNLLKYNGIKADEFCVLHLTKTKYEFKEIIPDYEMFNKCLDIYNYVKGE